MFSWWTSIQQNSKKNNKISNFDLMFDINLTKFVILVFSERNIFLRLNPILFIFINYHKMYI